MARKSRTLSTNNQTNKIKQCSSTPQQSNLPHQIHSKDYCRTDTASRTVNFNNTFFPHCFQKWNNLSDDIKSLPSPV